MFNPAEKPNFPGQASTDQAPEDMMEEQAASTPEKVNEKLAVLEAKILEYRNLTGTKPRASFIDPSNTLAENTKFAATQQLRDEAELLWTELQDAKEATNPDDKAQLVANLEADLADFEANNVVEVEEDAA